MMEINVLSNVIKRLKASLSRGKIIHFISCDRVENKIGRDRNTHRARLRRCTTLYTISMRIDDSSEEGKTK